jgi:hypothetical protein
MYVRCARRKRSELKGDFNLKAKKRELFMASEKERKRKIKRKLIFSHVKRLRLRHKMLLCQPRSSLH